jgi:predicted metal-dependent peptidase
MYGERTAAAMTEIDGVLRALATDITLVCNDAAVQGIHVVRTIQEAAKRWGGGGGTDLRPAFAALALRRPRPEIVVAVTDGEIGSGYPSVEPPFKTIWTLVGANSEAMTCPWGARVVVPPLEGGK